MTERIQCPICGLNLADSVYAIHGSTLYKSCPNCSQATGQHAFRPCPSSFGFRHKPTGEPYVQSHCVSCRSNEGAVSPGYVSCQGMGGAGLRAISSVRLMTPGDGRIGTVEELRSFLSESVPRDGYRCRAGSCPEDVDGALVIFHLEGSICGMAQAKGVVTVPDGADPESHVRHLELHPETLVTFDAPIGPEEARRLIPEIDGPGSGNAVLDAKILPMLYERGPSSVIVDEPIPEEIPGDVPGLPEGAKRRITVNAYERNPKARELCIAHYRGADGSIACQICGMDFDEVYGLKNVIEVHHLVRLSDVGEEYIVDPIKDLIPVCPNCHRAIHCRNPPFSPDEVRTMMRDAAERRRRRRTSNAITGFCAHGQNCPLALRRLLEDGGLEALLTCSSGAWTRCRIGTRRRLTK